MADPRYKIFAETCLSIDSNADGAPFMPVLARLKKTFVGGCALAVMMSSVALTLPLQASAQSVGNTIFSEGEVSPDAQMLLEADELVYDDTNNSVAAEGNVQIAYDKYTLVAERVTYQRTTGRVIAQGGVEIVEPNGNRVFAEEIDITDDFQDGFVSALRVETPENTRFAAESAERRDGDIAVFNNGVYTACEVCKENPEKPPLWQIRAKRVIINNKTKTVSYEGASFELFGSPIAYLTRFSHADPSIKRKSGFILETPGGSDELGFSAGTSYFWALAPNYDLTVGGKYYTQQGFLGKAQWRHRTELGEYDIRFAGIDQQGKDEFKSTFIDANEERRGAIMSTGKFEINPRWKFGWNILAQSDDNFARTYSLDGFNSRKVTNEIYLTGLNKKNYFDLRAQKYLIQDSSQDQLQNVSDPNVADPDIFPGSKDRRQDQQAQVLPSFDYNVVSDDLVAGGQVSLDVNVTKIHRNEVDIVNYQNPDALNAADLASLNTPSLLPNERHHGIAGDYTRASAEAEWKASQIVGNGALVTASLSARGDAMFVDTDSLGTEYNPLTTNQDIYRAMPAGMLEIRYPLVANDGMVSQIFEPIAQIIVRPDETHIGEFPNEDAQSMVFDTTNLFERDKFSGYDRVEGGTRANVGFRYSASFNNGASINIAAGQSFHLSGKNSFAERDLVNAGLESGLESDRSDYVASIDLNTGTGFSAGLAGRFDEDNADLRRGEASVRYVDPTLALSGSYIFTDAQPNYGFSDDRHEVRGSASVRVSDYVRLFGNAAYDIENKELFSQGFGIAYDDSCFSLSVAYDQTDDRYDGSSIERSVMFRIGFRTIGETEFKRTLDENNEF